MTTAASTSSRRPPLALVGLLVLLLTACTGRGGGQLPPDVGFPGSASFGFSFSCEDKGGVNPPTGQLRIQLSYAEHGTNLLGPPFSIHGVVDEIDPRVESMLCNGQEPPPDGNDLIFLGRYRLTSASEGFPRECSGTDITASSCRFEVVVGDGDRTLSPSAGDRFAITLSSETSTTTTDCPPLAGPVCYITAFPDASVLYARAGALSSGNLTVE